ncbi:MAG: DedA family protein [Planctomycetota bacterium]
MIETFGDHPYLGVSIVFLLCGLGLPLPEEIVLVSAGYLCFKGLAEQYQMMMVCTGAILIGDLVPFALGRFFGTRLLRLRPMRFIISPQRLARFDRWFRRRGDLVIFFSRFVAGIRVVAYFTAGAMKMGWGRFIFLDMAGILLIVPPLVLVGNMFGATIEDAIVQITKVEKGILYTVLIAGGVVGLWTWLRWRNRQRSLVGLPVETYVEPSEEADAGTVESSTQASGPRLVPPLPEASPDEDEGTQAKGSRAP